MLVEGPRFRLWFAPDISPNEFNEAAGAICRVLVAGPPEKPGHRRAVAVRQCLALYNGAQSARAKILERKLKNYLSSGWLRERDMESLPHPRSPEKVLLHRLARVNDGKALCWRQFLRIAGPM
jgi:hypothetical protein